MITRKPVPLTPDEVAALNEARNGQVLATLAGVPDIHSEASALHALVVLGLRQVQEANQLEGYAALAASHNEEDAAYASAMRRRTRGDVE
jgi:hypothetical protein